MSGYLMRLTLRGRVAGEAQSLQPFVRSASPVAERDQRIGMTGFEGFEFGEALPAKAGSEQEDVFQSSVPPGITPAGDGKIATARRKIASPTAGGDAAAADMRTRTRAQSSSSGAGALDLAEAHDVSLSPSSPPTAASVSSTGGIHPEAPSLDDSRTGNVPRQFGPGAVHTRSIRQAHPIDSPRLEPSPGALAGHFTLPIERAGEVSADDNEAPRVVIGRINVEVIPPPAAPPSTATPRPGPLTAASVSVIGPLGGSIRPSQRLSLRHR